MKYIKAEFRLGFVGGLFRPKLWKIHENETKQKRCCLFEMFILKMRIIYNIELF